MNIAIPIKKFFIDRLKTYGKKKFDFHFWIKGLEEAEKGFSSQVRISFTIDPHVLESLKSQKNLYLRFKGPEIDFKPGEYRAIYAIFDPETKEIGAWEKYIILPKKDKQPASINCVLGTIERISEKRKKDFLLNDKDGILEYGQIRFNPSITNQFSRQKGGYVFMQTYLPQGTNNVQPIFVIAGADGIPLPIKGDLMAESWNSKTKIWSCLFFLDFSESSIGDNLLKFEIQAEKQRVLVSKEIKLTIKSY
jgi:hypothetical protein